MGTEPVNEEPYCAAVLISEPVNFICELAPEHAPWAHQDGAVQWMPEEAARDLDKGRN